jgi:RNA polymerase sigma factor (sigma-70 family)
MQTRAPKRIAKKKDVDSSSKEDAIGFFKKRLKDEDYTPKGHSFDIHRMTQYVELENSFWASIFSNKESREFYINVASLNDDFRDICVPLDEESHFEYSESYSKLANFLFAEIALAIRSKDTSRFFFHFVAKNVKNKTTQSIYKKIVNLRDALIKSNARFIVWVSNKEANARRIPEHDRADFFQNACMGFVHSLGKFDPKRNVNLTSYSAYWMRHYMSREHVNNHHHIRPPVYIEEMRARVRMFTARAELKGRTFLTDAEICRGARVSPKHYNVIKHLGPVSSLDAPINFKGEKLDAYDIIPAPQKDDTFDGIENNVKQIIECAGLTNIELCVIQRRFGLDDRDEECLEQIGNDYGLSKERIRQLEKLAIEKLRNQADKLGIDY